MRTALLSIGTLLILAFVFQVFFRYEYRGQGDASVRIDRLTHTACRVRLGASPNPFDRALTQGGWSIPGGPADTEYCR